MSFTNKVVLITGAGSGFGEAIALKFAKLSASLSLIDMNEENLEKSVAQCHDFNEGKVLKHTLDLRNDDLVQNAVTDTVQEFGKIDVVINCAGIIRPEHGSILNPKAMENYDTVMAVNLRALIRLTNCVAPILIESKGCIVNISSAAAMIATTDVFAYSISKSAVNHFTKCIAVELAPHGVRANTVVPGAARTNVFLNAGVSSQIDQSKWESVIGVTPLRRLVEAEDIADMAVYLASDSAKNITGADFAVDGGLSINRLSTFTFS